MNEVSNDKNLPIEMDWLKQWSLFSPKNIAFKDAESNVEYSYHDLYYLSCVLATNLRERFSIAEGSRVAVLATNELEFIPLFFALQRLGAVMVPINFRLTAHFNGSRKKVALRRSREPTIVLECRVVAGFGRYSGKTKLDCPDEGISGLRNRLHDSLYVWHNRTR